MLISCSEWIKHALTQIALFQMIQYLAISVHSTLLSWNFKAPHARKKHTWFELAVVDWLRVSEFLYF